MKMWPFLARHMRCLSTLKTLIKSFSECDLQPKAGFFSFLVAHRIKNLSYHQRDFFSTAASLGTSLAHCRVVSPVEGGGGLTLTSQRRGRADLLQVCVGDGKEGL